MRISKVMPGRILVQFKPPETKRGSIYLPENSRNKRQDEVAVVVLKGEATAKNGQPYDVDVKVGDLVWVHPAFGDRWREAEGKKGEVRSYSFDEIRGVVEAEEGDGY